MHLPLLPRALFRTRLPLLALCAPAYACPVKPGTLGNGLMELCPGLVIEFDKHIEYNEFDGFSEHFNFNIREMVELVVEATGMLTRAEIAWLISDCSASSRRPRVRSRGLHSCGTGLNR